MITNMINMPINFLKREICEIKIKIGIFKKERLTQHATSYAGMELIAYGGTDTHHGRKILWRKIQREGRRASRTVTVSHAPIRRAFP
jgi:hypothetical protein